MNEQKASILKLRERVKQALNSKLGDEEKEIAILGEIDDVWMNINHKLNVIIRLYRLHVREKFARRLLFEINGSFVGGHPLPSDWKEEDWSLYEIYKKKVREVLNKKSVGESKTP